MYFNRLGFFSSKGSNETKRAIFFSLSPEIAGSQYRCKLELASFPSHLLAQRASAGTVVTPLLRQLSHADPCAVMCNFLKSDLGEKDDLQLHTWMMFVAFKCC